MLFIIMVEFEEIINTRRSIREYQDKDVEDEKNAEICDALRGVSSVQRNLGDYARLGTAKPDSMGGGYRRLC